MLFFGIVGVLAWGMQAQLSVIPGVGTMALAVFGPHYWLILGAYALLLKNPEPSAGDIADALEGNLCRCGSYNRIIQAIQTAARVMRGERS